MITAGAEPEDTSWWTVDDLWVHALDAVVTFVRAAAERHEMSLAGICDHIRQLRQSEGDT